MEVFSRRREDLDEIAKSRASRANSYCPFWTCEIWFIENALISEFPKQTSRMDYSERGAEALKMKRSKDLGDETIVATFSVSRRQGAGFMIATSVATTLALVTGQVPEPGRVVGVVLAIVCGLIGLIGVAKIEVRGPPIDRSAGQTTEEDRNS
jgi:hypothetical protein